MKGKATGMTDDFRLKRRDAALTRADKFEQMADMGGDAYWDAEAYRQMAASSREFAAWIDTKIRDFPNLT